MLESRVLRDAVRAVLLRDVDEQCKKLCKDTPSTRSKLNYTEEDGSPSPLNNFAMYLDPNQSLTVFVNSLENFTWESIVTEMKQRAPDVLDYLVAIAVPQKNQSGEHVPPLCTAYGILMNSRWKELSLIQKINGILLVFRNATKRREASGSPDVAAVKLQAPGTCNVVWDPNSSIADDTIISTLHEQVTAKDLRSLKPEIIMNEHPPPSVPMAAIPKVCPEEAQQTTNGSEVSESVSGSVELTQDNQQFNEPSDENVKVVQSNAGRSIVLKPADELHSLYKVLRLKLPQQGTTL
ncbi:hypothetical protein ACROYT_G015091 [Oculina patagonica]